MIKYILYLNYCVQCIHIQRSKLTVIDYLHQTLIKLSTCLDFKKWFGVHTSHFIPLREIALVNRIACNIVDFRNLSHNHFNNIDTDILSVQDYITIDLSYNEFENFEISWYILPQLTSL